VSKLKTVLWVTSYFPPRVNVATNRNIKFIKYLPHFGWSVLVVSPRETGGHTNASQRLMNQLNPAVKVLPMPPDPFHFLFDRADSSRVARYLGYLMNNIIPPDGHLFWSLSALRRIGKEIEKLKPDVIYTTCTPFSINLIGAWVKFRYKIPWVTDFRDLWTLTPMRRSFLNAYHHFVSTILEKLYLGFCDALIVNTKRSESRMKEKYSFLKNKIWTVPNGFDPEDICIKNHHNIEKTFFYGGLVDKKSKYTPLPVLMLLSRLKEKGFLKMPWELDYAGNEGGEFIEICHQAGINDNIRVHGYLNHESLYDLIQSMDYVIMCMPRDVDSTSWIPAKFYDYIGNNSRIICMADRMSEVTDMIKQYGNGITIFYDESENSQIQKLQNFLSNPPKNSGISEKFIAGFSRKNLTMQLSSIFQNIIDH
jgi:glycosyltransferase involved in cell wall biosynthesis